ncbi:MAG TPA: family 20 glycosylhydrolase [Acidimicrobiales bacterium]|nr:family 20 glycosylhydrolase [Acidimicrobiales bacterium]
MNLLPAPRSASFLGGVVAASPARVARGAGLPAQGYRLRVRPSGDCDVDAADDAGAFYAEATLAQLARVHGGCLPVGEVEDWPDLPVRGVMLDVSRDKVPTMATLEAMVDRLASWKVNQLQLYMEHTFAYAAHAEVWRSASPFTPDELRSLDAYCRTRHVELVPNQNCLGHFERWLRHPAYRGLALCPEGFEQYGRWRAPTTLDPANPAAFALVRSLLGELLPNFSSGRVHVGLDEPFELGWDRFEDYLSWVRRLRALPELDGREMLMWGDLAGARPESLGALPDGVTVCEWWYDAGWSWAARGDVYRRAGRPWWACPGTSSWLTLLGRWDNAIADIDEAVDGALASGAAGMLVTDWGDQGHLQYLPVSEPGLAWAAAQAWCRAANQGLDLAAALDAHCFSDAAGVLGAVLRQVGNAYLEIAPQFPNLSTLALHLYFPEMDVGRGLTEGITAAQVEAADAALAGGAARLAAARPAREDGGLVVDELTTAIELVRLLCRDALLRLDGDGSLASVAAPRRVELAEALAAVTARHRELWLARNREGGLDDSVAWLAALERCYRSGSTTRPTGP